MEKAITAPIDRLDAPAQIVPAGDRMDGLILDDLFQHIGGRIPRQPPQFEKAGVEPGGEGIFEFGVKRLEPGIASLCSQQVGAHGQQPACAAWRKIEHVDQLEAGRFAGIVECLGRALVACFFPAGNGEINCIGISRIKRMQFGQEGLTCGNVAGLIKVKKGGCQRRTGSAATQREQCAGEVEQTFAARGLRRDAKPAEQLAKTRAPDKLQRPSHTQGSACRLGRALPRHFHNSAPKHVRSPPARANHALPWNS